MDRLGIKNYDVGNHLQQKLEAQLANVVNSFYSIAQNSLNLELKQKNSQLQRNNKCLITSVKQNEGEE